MPILNIRDMGTVGVNTDVAPWELPPAALSYGFNFRMSAGKIQSAGGVAPVGPDFNDKVGVAVRFSNNEQSTVDQGDYEKFTIAPNYAITDSLGAILEYSDVENNNNKTEEYAVELTYTF